MASRLKPLNSTDNSQGLAADLPNELIHEILQYLFHIPLTKFQDTSVVSPFSTPDHVPSSLLLQVCKRWATIGTSLLYNVVILRSKPQARALQRTLREHPNLGNYIRMLRVEGGYGWTMGTILTCAPNIIDLFISPSLGPNDSITGLEATLPSINPTRVVVQFSYPEDPNEFCGNLARVMIACFEIWTNMTEVMLAGRYFNFALSSLAKAQNLQIVTLCTFACGLRALAANQSLKAIGFLVQYEPLHEEYLTDSRVKELVQFASPPPKSPSIDRSSSLSLALSLRVSEDIWDRIIRFAFEVDACRDESISVWPLLAVERMVCITRLSITLVSRKFRKLSLPYTYGYPIFVREKQLISHAATIASCPSLGNHLYSLVFAMGYKGPHHLSDDGLASLHCILLHSSCLHRLFAIGGRPFRIEPLECSLALSQHMCQTLASVAGSTLAVLRDVVFVPDESFNVFTGFSVLQSCEFSLSAPLYPDVDISSTSLSTLEFIGLMSPHRSAFQMLSHMELTGLRRFTLYSKVCGEDAVAFEVFLQKHGPKIEILSVQWTESGNLPVLDFCPNVTHLKLLQRGRLDPTIFRCQPGRLHSSLEKVEVHGGDVYSFMDRPWYSDRRYPKFFSHELLTHLGVTFPKLRIFQIWCVEWPTTTSDILCSDWPNCADAFTKMGIKLVDAKGRYWRPRLQ